MYWEDMQKQQEKIKTEVVNVKEDKMGKVKETSNYA